ALWIGFQNVAEFPADRVHGNALLQVPDGCRRKNAAEQPPDNRTHPNIDFQDVQDLAAVFMLLQEGNVVDPHHFPALRIDNLLIEQIANHAQHVFVGVIGRQAFVFKLDAIGADTLDLVIADAQPRWAGPDKVAVQPDRVDQWYKRGIAECPDPAALQIVHFDA